MKTPKNNIEKKALELFERALKHPKEQRISFIESETGDNETLKKRALTLLILDAQSGSKILTHSHKQLYKLVFILQWLKRTVKNNRKHMLGGHPHLQWLKIPPTRLRRIFR